MIRKLDTGEYLSTRGRDEKRANRIRPSDPKAEQRHEDNKKALFRKM